MPADWSFVYPVAKSPCSIPRGTPQDGDESSTSRTFTASRSCSRSPANPVRICRRTSQSLCENGRCDLHRARSIRRINSPGSCRTLEASSVRALAVKGPSLGVLAYPHASLRPSIDLDILVSPTEAERAVSALLHAGFKRIDQPIVDTPHRHIENEESLIGPDGFTAVDLHWALLPMGHAVPSTFEDLWRRSQIVNFPTGSARTLANDDLLLYLAQHGAKHGWERLLWICDIAMLAPLFSDLEWESLLQRCGRTGTLRMVQLSLLLARFARSAIVGPGQIIDPP